MLKSLLASLFLATAALAQENPSAYEALKVVGTQLNRDLMNRVISVTGVDGDPQPRSWQILVADRSASGGVREIVVTDNRIAAQRIPNRSVVGSPEGNTINTARLNLDSTGAYAVASHTAETSHVVFSFVSYTLRTDRGNPTWVVSLEDRSRRPLGTIHIKAHDGRVSRVEGMYQGRNMEQVEQDPADGSNVDSGDDPEDNVVKRNFKRLYRKTKEDANRIFNKVRRSFADFIAPNED
jgi:hypothetical protein